MAANTAKALRTQSRRIASYRKRLVTDLAKPHRSGAVSMRRIRVRKLRIRA